VKLELPKDKMSKQIHENSELILHLLTAPLAIRCCPQGLGMYITQLNIRYVGYVRSWANPTIVSYNAIAEIIYNATCAF
jgi:hypothetical protein